RQLTIAGGLPRVFDIGPAWRAEQSHTVKHLCEHRVCAVEVSFIKDERDVERVEEQIVISALTKVKEKCGNELKILGVEVKIPKAPFPEFCFPELYDILAKKGKILPPGSDMDTEAEKILWEYVKENYDSEFYFVNRFPFKIKPFYVMRVDDQPDRARSIDLYFKGLELSSGGQREHRYEKILEHLKEKGVRPESVEWFTKFFKYGVPSHGGFAIGIERITQSLLNVENIRDCVLFPRDPDRLVP
ncbi:aspartate--tRNA(Asn) ligase, partial [archaeon]|nr:aspartate--tRNA(Asn) ligase [archaeon]